MISFNENNRVDFLAKNDDAADSSTVSSYLSMENYAAIAFVGEIGAPGGVWSVMRILQATDSSGTGAKAVTGAAMTAFTAMTAAGDRFVIELPSDALDVANGFNHVALDWGVSDATGSNFINAISVRFHPRFAHRALNMADSADVSTNVINAG